MQSSIETALSKRIKRHVIGRKQRFFAATAPGLEVVCFNELKSFLPAENDIEAVSGGVRFGGRLKDCYMANLHLHTANRVLMRIRSFFATDFWQFEKHLKDIAWELYLQPGLETRIFTTSHHSRLYHKEAIAERIQESIFSCLGSNTLQASDKIPAGHQKLFVRIFHNKVTISIDSSGDLLYRRGIKTHHARAPLRETIAAAALILAGYTGSEPLVDPMCGSGSFSLEAALMAQHIPPGWNRDFAFSSWPSFQDGRWKHIRREAETKINPLQAPVIFASDQDEQTVKTLEKNIVQKGLDRVISVATRNFFDLVPTEWTDRTGLLALNPPFGYRLGSRRESDKLLRAVFQRLQTEYKGWKLALVAPKTAWTDQIPFKLTRHILPLGGLQVVLLTGRID